LASLNAAAAHVFCATKTFNEKVAAGVTKRARPNEWNLDVVRRDFFAHFRAGASGRARAAGALDLAAERARLARAQTENMQRKNDIANGAYVAVADVGAIIAKDYGVIRERLLTMPGAVSDALAHRSRDEIEETLRDEIYSVLGELSDPGTVADKAGRK